MTRTLLNLTPTQRKTLLVASSEPRTLHELCSLIDVPHSGLRAREIRELTHLGLLSSTTRARRTVVNGGLATAFAITPKGEQIAEVLFDLKQLEARFTRVLEAS